MVVSGFTPRKGPVFLELPLDTQATMVDLRGNVLGYFIFQSPLPLLIANLYLKYRLVLLNHLDLFF